MDEKPKSSIARFFIITAGIVVVLFGYGSAFFIWLNEPPAGMPHSAIVTVNAGETFRGIAQRLQQDKIIRSWAFLDAVSVLGGTAKELKTGRYRIERGATTLNVHNVLVSGHQLLVRVTIPEGWTLTQTAERLQAEKIVSKSEFLAAARSPALLKKLGIPAESAEGFLFPDTYEFPENYPAEKVLATMSEDFFGRLTRIYPDYRKLTGRELLHKVTLASIVEGEYRVAAEAPVIASVFYNRLHEGMRLQSCATVSYVLTDIKGMPHQTRLYDKDLKVESPYNTYLHPGLPPGPINAPGTVALHAVFYPAKTNYIYFVLENPQTGRHFFSRTFKAHLMATYRLMNLYLKQS